MKKFLLSLIIAITVLFAGSSFAQSSKYGWLPQDSWAFGFGGTYPRYISTNLTVVDFHNVGGFVSIQRNFSEHVGLRLKVNYLHLEGHLGNPKARTINNNLFGGNLDVLYYLAPSEPFSPYIGVGLGGYTQSIDGYPAPSTASNKSVTDYQFNANFGVEWKVGVDWKLTTEFGYHSTASRYFDGSAGTVGGGILGGQNDTYMTFDFGLLYYFNKGPVSKLNDLYTGIKNDVDYDRIESMIKKYATEPTTVDYDRIEDIVKKYQSTFEGGNLVIGSKAAGSTGGQWVLVGVNFDFNKTSLRPESIPILYNAAQILLSHPKVNVEIQGYTDNTGSAKYNKQLSQKRANAVRDFLIAKGVAASRLTAVGYGEANPVMDNKTATGRAFNRRIEFKVK